jgi:hypothetical protein
VTAPTPGYRCEARENEALIKEQNRYAADPGERNF